MDQEVSLRMRKTRQSVWTGAEQQRSANIYKTEGYRSEAIERATHSFKYKIMKGNKWSEL